jgi:hypothetical protein
MRSVLLMMLGLAFGGLVASVARADEVKTDIYGYVMMDAGYNSIAIDPAWFDVQRPTKLPSFDHEFGKDGNTFFSVRQTRFGVKSWFPTEKGTLKTIFEWEMFGTGVDAGQTTIRLRHAYGELGKFGAGQYWSPFMDIDVFPNTIEYWGPPGMAFFRNVQVRYMPIQKGDNHKMTIALERPGASGDQGNYADHIATGGTIIPRFPLPDLSAEYRVPLGKGYVEGAGIVRDIQWEDNNPAPPDFSGGTTGWGFNLSSNIKPNDDNVIRLSALYGEGIENYMNDAPVDVGPEPISVSPGVKGKALPVTGVVAFLDHTWSKKASSSVGYSMVHIDNSGGMPDDAFKTGHYVLGNVLFYPATNLMAGVEGGWIQRENFRDGFKSDDAHIQFSARYNFNVSIGGGGQ